MRQRAADHADEDHQRRRGEAAAHHDGLEHIVGERCRHQTDRDQEGCRERLGRPKPDDHGDDDDGRADLNDPQHHAPEGEQSGVRDVGQLQDDPDQQSLRHGDADDTLCHRADGGAAPASGNPRFAPATTRDRKLLEAATSRGAAGNRNPVNSTAMRNFRVPTPASPARPQILPATGFSCGDTCPSSVCSWSTPVAQNAKICGPTIGQSLICAGGAGMASVPAPSLRGEAAQPLDGAETEPGRRADDDREVDDGEESRGPFRAGRRARARATGRRDRARPPAPRSRPGSARTDRSPRTTSRSGERAARGAPQAGFRPRRPTIGGSFAIGARSQTKLFQVRRLPAKPRTAD